MKRLLLVALVPLALVMSACAVGEPKPPTDVTDTAATLNGVVYSSVQGDTEYWFRWGTTSGYGSETSHGQIAIEDDLGHAVSAPISGLAEGTRYHWQMCVQDDEEDPPRTVCSNEQRFDTTGPTRYIALGDSVTQIGSALDPPQRYPERFFGFLQGAGAAEQLRNIGVSGATSRSLIDDGQLDQAQQLIDDPSTDTTVVTIDIGANDTLGDPSCNPTQSSFDLDNCQSRLAQVSTNFDATLDALSTTLADDPGVERLMVMAYYNPWSGRSGQTTEADRAELALLGADRTLDCTASGTDLGLNDRIKCISDDHGARLADTYPPFVGHGIIGDYFADTIHPNDAGHQVIADTFKDAF